MFNISGVEIVQIITALFMAGILAYAALRTNKRHEYK